MNATELKSLQAPLKEKYREDPLSAFITLKAQGDINEGISCSIETGKAIVQAGLHPATGGTGMLACSGFIVAGISGLCRCYSPDCFHSHRN
jgi:hypothetical protein